MANYGNFDLSKLSVSRPGAIKLAFRELGVDATVEAVRDYAREHYGLDVNEKMIQMIRQIWASAL